MSHQLETRNFKQESLMRPELLGSCSATYSETPAGGYVVLIGSLGRRRRGVGVFFRSRVIDGSKKGRDFQPSGAEAREGEAGEGGAGSKESDLGHGGSA